MDGKQMESGSKGGLVDLILLFALISQRVR
jgi:hypothetical protein